MPVSERAETDLAVGDSDPALRIWGEKAEPRGAQGTQGKEHRENRNPPAKPDYTVRETSAKRPQRFGWHPQTRMRSKHSDIPFRRSPHTDKQNSSAAVPPGPGRVSDRVPA